MGILRTDRITHSSLEPTGSVLFDGTTDSITIPSHNALAFGTADWTVEGWFYFTSLSGQQTIVGDTYGATAGWYLYKQSNNRLGVYYTSLLVDGVTEVEANRWYHLAFVRRSGITSIYIDGVSDKSATDTTNATITQYYIADTADQSSGEFFGYISNLRITRTAVYKENFTVPKSELKNIPGTILLCCQSSSSTTESAVSVAGTLTANGDPTATSFTPDLKKDITDIGPVFADNTKFDTLSYMVPPKGTTAESNRGRGIFAGGYTPTPSDAALNTISYVQIQSLGSSIDFGDLNKAACWGGSACASSIRGFHCGGTTPTNLDSIDYITIATTANAENFGNLRTGRGYTQAASNNTRGIIAGGRGGTPVVSQDSMDYIQFATTGQTAGDFGDMNGNRVGGGALASPTRVLIIGGNSGPDAPSTRYATIDRVVISTLSTAVDFGDMTSGVRGYMGCASSTTRGLIGGGQIHPAKVNNIDYVTIASDGNSVDFGDLLDDREHAGATSNGLRAIWAGGVSPYRNSIEYVTISTTGNAQDFGDAVHHNYAHAYLSGTSDSHGGIS